MRNKSRACEAIGFHSERQAFATNVAQQKVLDCIAALNLNPAIHGILVVAAGVPKLITAPMVKTGAVVIDVGINRLPDGGLVGDVDFDALRRKASLITPAPSGVGLMTVTMLPVNTIPSAERAKFRADSLKAKSASGKCRG